MGSLFGAGYWRTNCSEGIGEALEPPIGDSEFATMAHSSWADLASMDLAVVVVGEVVAFRP